jgi:hypothetical protein
MTVRAFFIIETAPLGVGISETCYDEILRIGIHTFSQGTLEKTALKAHELGANTFQIRFATRNSERALAGGGPETDDKKAFCKYGQSCIEVSVIFPRIGGLIDKFYVIRSMWTGSRTMSLRCSCSTREPLSRGGRPWTIG